jgi:hypothetical protein
MERPEIIPVDVIDAIAVFEEIQGLELAAVLLPTNVSVSFTFTTSELDVIFALVELPIIQFDVELFNVIELGSKG